MLILIYIRRFPLRDCRAFGVVALLVPDIGYGVLEVLANDRETSIAILPAEQPARNQDLSP